MNRPVSMVNNEASINGLKRTFCVIRSAAAGINIKTPHPSNIKALIEKIRPRRILFPFSKALYVHLPKMSMDFA